MPQIKLDNAYRVDIKEYERGWGSRVDETLYFDNEAEAKQYAEDYNRKHNPPGPAPDWYMIAIYAGKAR